MKNLLLFVLLLGVSLSGNISYASSLSCYDVDGMAIFGYDWSEWKHIGAIGNSFNSLSIANEYGAGSEYKTTSIFNEYGKYGGKYSSNSAFNDYATKPPIIINNDYKFVGYLTINTSKSPYINTYEAIACANNSFKSPNRDMQDITFKDIPSSTNYSSSWSAYVGSGNESTTNTQFSCPAHSSESLTDATNCSCDSGYQVNKAKTKCVKIPKKTNDKLCQATFGNRSEWNGKYDKTDNQPYCKCKKKYEWNDDQTSCIKPTS